MTLDNCPPVLKVDEAAEVARVDGKTIRRAVHRGDLRALVHGNGRVIRIHRDALAAWLQGENKDDHQQQRLAVVEGGRRAWRTPRSD